MSKTNKLRGENYLRRFIRETQTYDGDLWMRVSDVAKAIKEAKSQWKQEALKEVRQLIANYISSEGCSCCEGFEHDEHKEKLAELLGVPKYNDGSGYNFGKFENVKKQ